MPVSCTMEFSLPVGSHIGQPRRVTALSSNVAVLPLSEPQANRAGSVISKIEAILEAILDDLSLGVGEISIPYRSRTATARSMTRHAEPGTTPGGHVNDVVRFPGRTTHEARKFGKSSTSTAVPLRHCSDLLPTSSCSAPDSPAVPGSHRYWCRDYQKEHLLSEYRTV